MAKIEVWLLAALLGAGACGGTTAPQQPLAAFVLTVSAPVTPNITGGCVVSIGFSDGVGYTAQDRKFASTNISVSATRGGPIASDTLWMEPGHYHARGNTDGAVQAHDWPYESDVPGRLDEAC